MNVLLITADTLRADHMSCYGYWRQTSPTLDQLAGGRPSALPTFTNLDPPTLPAHRKGNVTVVALADFLTRIPEENRATTKLIIALEHSLWRGGEMVQLDSFDPE